MSAKIRGEYWIQDGQVDFADGDIGDKNHEIVALDAVASDHIDGLQDYAQELGLDAGDMGIHEEPFTTASELLNAIYGELLESGLSSAQIAETIAKKLGVDMEVYKMLGGGGDARLHVMRNKGWIAVRDNNAELFGYDAKKRKELADGIEEILEQEGLESADEEVEVSVYDHKTGRSFDATLADLKGGSAARPQNLPSTTYNRPILATPQKTGPMPKPMDARTRNMLQTSEARLGFRKWLAENCGQFMIRRSWPFLIASETEPPESRSSHRTRRGRRRSV